MINLDSNNTVPSWASFPDSSQNNLYLTPSGSVRGVYKFLIRVRYNGVTENHYDREIAITDDVSQELGFALIVIIALTTVIVIGVMAVTIIL